MYARAGDSQQTHEKYQRHASLLLPVHIQLYELRDRDEPDGEVQRDVGRRHGVQLGIDVNRAMPFPFPSPLFPKEVCRATNEGLRDPTSKPVSNRQGD